MAESNRSRVRRFVALQIAVPAGVLAWRLATGAFPFYGWGWEMYS